MMDTFERFNSADVTIENNTGSAVSRWIHRGAATMDEALFQLRIITPQLYQAGAERLIRQRIAARHIGPGIWEAEVTYGPEDDGKSEREKGPGDYDFAFDTMGATAKKQISESTRSRQWLWSMSNMPPDLKGVIGAQRGAVEGVEVIVPKLEFSVTAYYAPGRVTVDWVKNLARMTGKTNRDAWLGFEAGELLFLGARGNGPIDTLVGPQRKPVSISLTFGASENRDDIVIGTGNPEKIAKRGWDYLWVRYERVQESGLDYPVPVHAYVEQVYPEDDFTPFFGFG